MHRRITFHGHSDSIRALARELVPLDTVIALSHHQDRSLKPPGDVLEIEVLNRGADEVMRRARPRMEDRAPGLAIAISQSTALVEREHRDLIEHDADEAMWEEMESDL